MSNEAAFVAFWQREFPDQQCPPMPRELGELGLTHQMAMKDTAPDLYTAMFAGRNEVRLPADVSLRLSTGQQTPNPRAEVASRDREGFMPNWSLRSFCRCCDSPTSISPAG